MNNTLSSRPEFIQNSSYAAPRTAFRLLSILLLAVATGLFAHAASQPRAQWEFGLDPQAILASASAVPDSTGSEVTVLSEEQRVSIDEQGRATETWRMAYKVNSAKGVEDWANVNATWAPWHQERPVIKARVITADGQVHLLDPKTMTDSPIDSDSEQTFSDDRRYRGPLPAVAIGAVIEEEIVTRDTAPFFAHGLAYRQYVSRSVPIQLARVVVEVPQSVPLHYAVHLLPEADVQRETTGGITRLTVEVGPIKALRNEHSHRPVDAPLWPHVDFSTGNSWAEVADAYRKDADPQIQPEALKDFLPATSPTASRDEVIRAVLSRLHKHIRYTGVEFGHSKLVPVSTSEILKRKFGDCKDKASLLIAMLRAKGIPAHLALLVASSDTQDVEPDMPGMGLFDHAIVVVPGTPDLWIDATADLSPLGELPSADQGRLALVVREGVRNLQRVPETLSTNNVTVETREFFLSESGPARVVEVTIPKGRSASNLRRQFNGKISDDGRKELENYMQTEYAAEKLTRAEASDGSDLEHPYTLTLESARAPRGSTDEESSVVGVPLGGIFIDLPEALRIKQDEDTNEKKAEFGREAATPRTADFLLPEAYVHEWRYTITPPPGFRIHGLPEAKVLPIGPAKLSEEFHLNADNSVSATFRFDSVKRRYTAEETRQIRAAILKINASPMLLISFDQLGYALLQEGKIRESLAAYRSLINLHPKEGLHRAQLANALLQAGLGDKARIEAAAATKQDPNSAFAFKTLGWILQHDSIGRRFATGYDREGAIAAYRKAKALDPKDAATRADLAILLEHDINGERYTPQASLNDSIQEYREIRQRDKDNTSYDDNLAYTLFYARRFREAREFLTEVGTSNNNRRALVIAATAAESDTAAALKTAAELTSNPNDRTTCLYTASQFLMYLRRYSQSAELMQAGMTKQSTTPQSLALLDMLRRTKPAETVEPPADAAQAVLHKLMLEVFTGADKDPSIKFASKNALDDSKSAEERQKEYDKQRQALRMTRQISGWPFQVLGDIIFANLRFSTEPAEGGMTRLTMQGMGSKPQHFFLVTESGEQKVLGAGGADMAESGREVLDRLARGDNAAAKKLLDWMREEITINRDDDPLSGASFPRFWRKGQAAEPAAMEFAAAALMIDGKSRAPRAVAIMQRGLDSATQPDIKTNFELALAREALKEKNWADLKTRAQHLMKAEPTSGHAYFLEIAALQGVKEWAAAEQLAHDRLTQTPDDLNAQRSLYDTARIQGQFDKSRSILKPLIDNGRATSEDMNRYTWMSLFTGSVRPEDIEIAQRGSSAEQNRYYPLLHTLACLHAASGNTKQAYELLLESMKLQSLDKPDSAIWLGVGLIAEQYGEYEAARNAYARVEKADPSEVDSPNSSYSLAQIRLKIVAAELKKPQSSAAGN